MKSASKIIITITHTQSETKHGEVVYNTKHWKFQRFFLGDQDDKLALESRDCPFSSNQIFYSTNHRALESSYNGPY